MVHTPAHNFRFHTAPGRPGLSLRSHHKRRTIWGERIGSAMASGFGKLACVQLRETYFVKRNYNLKLHSGKYYV